MGHTSIITHSTKGYVASLSDLGPTWTDDRDKALRFDEITAKKAAKRIDGATAEEAS